MSIAEKLTAIANNIPKVLKAGVPTGESNIWDIVQNYGKRTIYENGFRYWGAEYIRPKYKIVPKSSSRNIQIFENCRKLKKVEKIYFDLSSTSSHNIAENTSSNYAIFRNCDALEEVEDIGIQAGGYYFTWGGCLKLHTIAIMRCVKEGTYQSPFRDCENLKNITVEGEIGNDFPIPYSPLLTAESLVSIVTALFDFTGTDEYTRTLTLNSKSVKVLNALGETSPNGNTWVEYIDDKKWNLTLA